jgi:hypothetical protein
VRVKKFTLGLFTFYPLLISTYSEIEYIQQAVVSSFFFILMECTSTGNTKKVKFKWFTGKMADHCGQE